MQSGKFSLFFFDVKQCSVLCWDGKLRFAVLPLGKPSWNEFGLSFVMRTNSVLFVRDEFGLSF